MVIQLEYKSAKSCNVKFNYNMQLVDLTKTIPDRKWDSNNKCWVIPMKSVKIAKEIFNNSGHDVLIDDKIHVAVKDIETKESILKDKLVKKKLDFDVCKLEYKNKPFPHQLTGIERMLQSDNMILGDDMGLGKTYISINASVIRKQLGLVNKVLVLCGINSVKYNWQEEISVHSNEKGTVFDGKNIKHRLELLENWINNVDTNFFGIINVESLQKTEIVAVLQKAIKQNVISMIIIDEAHKIKNPTSIRGKALQKLNPKYKVALTGTPIMNRPDEAYNILKWIGAETGTYTNFKNFYCTFGGFCNREIVGYKNLKHLNDTLNMCMLRRKKEDVLDLPEKVYKTEYVELSAKGMKFYMDVRQELVKKIDELVLDSNPLSKLLRLRQITGGLLGEDTSKLDRLLEIVEDHKLNKRKMIIFTQWKAEADVITRAIKDKVYKRVLQIDGSVSAEQRQHVVNVFQNSDEFEIVVGTIGACGTGLTLNKAETVVFMDKAWTPADNRQAEDRAYRIGTKHTVNIVSLVVKNTIDEYIENILNEKQDLFNMVVEGVDTSKQTRANLIKQLLGVSEI